MKLKELARVHQVICITHLPQIACFADYHYLVSKHEVRDRTVTKVAMEEGEARVREIARMLGGDTSGHALDYARELIARAAGS